MIKKLWEWVKSRFIEPEEKEPEEEPFIPDHLTGRWKLAKVLDMLPHYYRRFSKSWRYWNSELGPVMRMGPTIISKDNAWFIWNNRDKDDDGRYPFPDKLPTQVFVSWLDDGKAEAKKNAWPTFVAMMKVEPPLTVERFPGECYKVLIDIHLEELNFHDWFSGHVWIDGNTMHIARERCRVLKHLKTGKNKNAVIPSIRYDTPLLNCLTDKREDAPKALELIVRSAIAWWQERTLRWLVITKKKNRRISFAVEPGQQVYFFKDRDKIVTTPTGQRKRIFHLVRGHYRKVKGKKRWIREHKRGQRHFFWNGYECHIFAPGWHGGDIFSQLDVTTYQEDDTPEELWNEMLPAAGVAEKFVRVIEGTNRERQ